MSGQYRVREARVRRLSVTGLQELLCYRIAVIPAIWPSDGYAWVISLSTANVWGRRSTWMRFVFAWKQTGSSIGVSGKLVRFRPIEAHRPDIVGRGVTSVRPQSFSVGLAALSTLCPRCPTAWGSLKFEG